MRACFEYRRGNSCPKAHADNGYNEKQMTGDCDLFSKLQSLCSNCSSISNYFTSMFTSWWYRSDSALPVKKSFHLHNVSGILDISMTSQLKCCVYKRNNTRICGLFWFFFFQLTYTETQPVNQKVNLVLLFFYIKPSIVSI